jgi:ubiquinone/menaquinone biosynthesis C-methylase UbiE
MSGLDRAFAAVYDPLLGPTERRWLGEQRRRLLEQATGEVLEIGGGTGANLDHYGSVDRLVVAEPYEPMRRRLEARARHTGRSIDVDAAPAEKLPYGDASFDTVVSTLVLCTVGDVQAALAEVRRVLRPSGRLLFLEHVRGHGRRGRLQDLATPVWRLLAGGCHPNRDTISAMRRQGLRVERVEELRPRGPLEFVVRPVVVGTATV